MSEFSTYEFMIHLVNSGNLAHSPLVLVKIQNGRRLACCLLVAGGVTAIVSIILTDSVFFLFIFNGK
jgi:hypothetical protein